ncbi:tRNA-specific adenosine deaminase (fragment) [Candidatus Desulfosporosinus infrequens]|uniref:tRNA-specific adenosine deaminase n=1 Tax=Candidatus Desulfosporosinus infrequens TaxID=2043169 RepID=A0A2U3LYS0_9FIRM
MTQNSALNHSMMVTSGVRTDECAGIMKDFFRNRRKQKKSDITIIDK